MEPKRAPEATRGAPWALLGPPRAIYQKIASKMTQPDPPQGLLHGPLFVELLIICNNKSALVAKTRTYDSNATVAMYLTQTEPARPDRTSQARPNIPGNNKQARPDRTGQARPKRPGQSKQPRPDRTSQARPNRPGQTKQARADRTSQARPKRPGQTEEAKPDRRGQARQKRPGHHRRHQARSKRPGQTE